VKESSFGAWTCWELEANDPGIAIRAPREERPPPYADDMSDGVRVPDARIALSTSSTYPESTASAFEIAARLGYDGVELMVFTDLVSQDVEAVRRLSDRAC